MPRFQKIVVAVDFSQTSEDALEAACELAQTHHGHVHLLHVVPDPVLLAYTTEPVSLDVDAMLRQWTDGAREQLTALAARQQPKPHSARRFTPSNMRRSMATPIGSFAPRRGRA